MSLSELLRTIEREASEELEHARAQAQAEADEVRRRALADAAALEQRLARAGADAVRGEADELRSAARRDAARTLLLAREGAWRGVAEALRAELAAQRNLPGWAGVLAGLLEEARAALPAATDAHVLSGDVALVQKLAPDLRVLGDADGCGGVVLTTDDGRRLDNTLEARLAAAEPRLRRRLAELLDTAQGEKAHA